MMKKERFYKKKLIPVVGMILARVIAGLYFHMKTGGVSGVLTRIREKFFGNSVHIS